MMREECWKDFGSPEAQKISAITNNTGSQYFVSMEVFDIGEYKTDFEMRARAGNHQNRLRSRVRLHIIKPQC